MNEKNLKNISRTNWQALDSMSDEDIDYSDIPPLTDEFFERATLRIPAAQAKNVIQLEPDVIAWFKAQNTDYQTAINEILRRHIESGGSNKQAA
ncbi:BrnA antitoxin family protein [Anabaena sp. PCC 7108]|uniref:BrnA antitoxin family protein n=1 Tax=Anabaena sp. PCC 7108 TaxID=163908 RepID=UPI000349255C|nr:BrnA antitoxin family protein [Anabaena sp. PCC 7108]